MNKNELVTQVAANADITKAAAADSIDAVVTAISDALADGDEVRLVGFGTFSVSNRKATQGRNPRTGAVIQIAASKQPKFKAGKSLKESTNSGKRSRKKAA